MFNKPSHITRAFVVGLSLCAGTSVSAEALASKFSYLIVETDKDGNEMLVQRNSVKPGEIIHYEIVHENLTDGSLSGIVVAVPVPDGVTLTLGHEDTSIKATFEVQAELDPEREGLEWSTVPASRKVLLADGSFAVEPLPEDDVLAVRWAFAEPLDAGDAALNSYRVRVD